MSGCDKNPLLISGRGYGVFSISTPISTPISTREGTHMRMSMLLVGLLFATGCCHRRAVCSGPKPVPKWSTEGTIGTSLYPNAPCPQHGYFVEKVDVGIKLRREW